MRRLIVFFYAMAILGVTCHIFGSASWLSVLWSANVLLLGAFLLMFKTGTRQKEQERPVRELTPRLMAEVLGESLGTSLQISAAGTFILAWLVAGARTGFSLAVAVSGIGVLMLLAARFARFLENSKASAVTTG